MRLKTKDDVNLLMYSAAPSAALGAAIETGLLWQLAARPMGAAEVAEALNIPGKRCNYWLQLLEQLGILENGPSGYAPTSLTREAILETFSQESRQYLVLDERERAAGIHNLPLYIREPGSIWAAQGLAEPQSYVGKMRSDPTRAREFTRTLFEVHQQLANEVVERIDMTGVMRVMDLGGGSGVVSMALLRKYAENTSTVVDIENVCVAGREIAEEEGLSERISYYPANFADDEFPAGYDLVMQCDVSVFNAALFQKVWKALKPEGRYVLVGRFSATEDYAPPPHVEWIFEDSLRQPDISVPTSDQVQTLLVQAGFEVSTEPLTFGKDWTMLEARKPRTSFSL